MSPLLGGSRLNLYLTSDGGDVYKETYRSVSVQMWGCMEETPELPHTPYRPLPPTTAYPYSGPTTDRARRDMQSLSAHGIPLGDDYICSSKAALDRY